MSKDIRLGRNNQSKEKTRSKEYTNSFKKSGNRSREKNSCKKR